MRLLHIPFWALLDSYKRVTPWTCPQSTTTELLQIWEQLSCKRSQIENKSNQNYTGKMGPISVKCEGCTVLVFQGSLEDHWLVDSPPSVQSMKYQFAQFTRPKPPLMNRHSVRRDWGVYSSTSHVSLSCYTWVSQEKYSLGFLLAAPGLHAKVLQPYKSVSFRNLCLIQTEGSDAPHAAVRWS